MQRLSDFTTDTAYPLGGGRSSSPHHRQARQFCEDFTGLEADINRYDLLLLVKRVGKQAGFSSKMVQLLDHFMAFTRDCDWEEGARPVVFQSQTKTALELGVTERQIQRLEQALFQAGAITWNDSGNHRRYGQRCPDSGRILYAYGVDLTPLAYLRPKLQALLDEKRLFDAAWLETKRQISWYRAQIRSLTTELDREEGAQWAAEYEAVATPIRTYHRLPELRALLERHKALYERMLTELESRSPTPKEATLSERRASTDDKKVVPKQITKQEPSIEIDTDCRPAASCLQESVPRSRHPEKPATADTATENLLVSAGLDKITLKQVLNAAGERFKAHIPMHNRALNASDLVEAAYQLRPQLQISQQSWGEACLVLGRLGAALCLLLTDRATQRENDPVRNPAAYFRSLVVRAQDRKLNLQASIMAILKREE